MRRAVLWSAVLLTACGSVVGYALHVQPAWYVRLRYPLAYESVIRAHAVNYHLDPALVSAVIYVESRFAPDTRSRAGAVGLMQLLPATAQGIADRTGGGGFRPADLVDPEINIRYGCWYLQHLREHYATRPDAMVLALAAYNAGQAPVDRWVAAAPTGKAVPIRYPETAAYVATVLDLEVLYRRGYGL
jgi:soluble lytic murein transglycosylase